MTSSTNPELVLCPIECINYDQPDFVEKHSTFLITLIGALSACAGVVLTYFLKSRCNKIKFGCIECERNVVNLEASQIEIQNTN